MTTKETVHGYLDRLTVAVNTYDNDKGNEPKRVAAQEQVTALFDELFTFLLEKFPDNPTQEEVRELFGGQRDVHGRIIENQMTHIERMSIDSEYSHPRLPITVARFVIQTLKAPIHTQKSTVFNTFTERYRTLIMDS